MFSRSRLSLADDVRRLIWRGGWEIGCVIEAGVFGFHGAGIGLRFLIGLLLIS